MSRLKRVVLIGDHHQLPPVVKNQAFQKYSHLDQSLFTRFIRLGTPYVQLNMQVRVDAARACAACLCMCVGGEGFRLHLCLAQDVCAWPLRCLASCRARRLHLVLLLPPLHPVAHTSRPAARTPGLPITPPPPPPFTTGPRARLAGAAVQLALQGAGRPAGGAGAAGLPRRQPRLCARVPVRGRARLPGPR